MSIVNINLDVGINDAVRSVLQKSSRGLAAIRKRQQRIFDLNLQEWVRQSLSDRNISVWSFEGEGVSLQMVKECREGKGSVGSKASSWKEIRSDLICIQLEKEAFSDGLFCGPKQRQYLLTDVAKNAKDTFLTRSEGLLQLWSDAKLKEGDVLHMNRAELMAVTHPFQDKLISLSNTKELFTLRKTVDGIYVIVIDKAGLLWCEGTEIRVNNVVKNNKEDLVRAGHYKLNEDILHARLWYLCLSSLTDSESGIVGKMIYMLRDIRKGEDLAHQLDDFKVHDFFALKKKVISIMKMIDTSAQGKFFASTRERVEISRAGKNAWELQEELRPVGIRVKDLGSESGDDSWAIEFEKYLKRNILDATKRIITRLTSGRNVSIRGKKHIPIRALCGLKVLLDYDAPAIIEKDLGKIKPSVVLGDREVALYVPESNMLYLSASIKRLPTISLQCIPGESTESVRPYVIDQILMSHMVPGENGPVLSDTLSKELVIRLIDDFDRTMVEWPEYARSKVTRLWKDQNLLFSEAMSVVYGRSYFRQGLDRSMMMWLLTLGARVSPESVYGCLPRLMRAERKMPSIGLEVNFDQALSSAGLSLKTIVTSDRNYFKDDPVVIDHATSKVYKLKKNVSRDRDYVTSIEFVGLEDELHLDDDSLDRSGLKIGGNQLDEAKARNDGNLRP